MGDSAKSQLDSILKSVVSRDSTGPADTMLVSAHLSQMKMFGIRQGVEFYPMQDNFGTQRYDFIQQVIKFNVLMQGSTLSGIVSWLTVRDCSISDQLRKLIVFIGSTGILIALTTLPKVT